MSEEDRKINELTNFGVPRDTARRALELYNWDVNRATNAYLDGVVGTTNDNLMNRMNNLNIVVPGAQQPLIRIDLNNNNNNIPRNHMNPFLPYRPRLNFTEHVFNEEDQEKLNLKLFPKEYEKKIVIQRINNSPKILPVPVDDEEYKDRFMSFEEFKEDRKTEFLKKTAQAYHKAREMYFDAVRLIFFIVTTPFRELRDRLSSNDPTSSSFKYTVPMHSANLKKVIIAVRKIAECSYFLGLYKESMNICRTNIAVCDVFSDFRRLEATIQYNCRKMLKLTYGVMGRIMMIKGNLKRAKGLIDNGLELDPTSGILQKSEDDLLCLVRGKDFRNDRYKVLEASNQFTFQTYPIRFPIGEIEYMEDNFEEDDYLGERMVYFLDEKIMKKQDLDHLLLTCNLKNNFSVTLWKSLI